MSTKVDIDHLRKWIGKIDNVTDYVTPIVEQRYRATLNMDIGNPKDGDPVTSGLHWMLGWNLVKNDELGVDSHPALGEFLPPVPLPRRMWAGSEIKVLKPIRVGAHFPGNLLEPHRTPRIEPTVAPLQSVSQPARTAVTIPDSKFS